MVWDVLINSSGTILRRSSSHRYKEADHFRDQDEFPGVAPDR